jgi:hypothetical protein
MKLCTTLLSAIASIAMANPIAIPDPVAVPGAEAQDCRFCDARFRDCKEASSIAPLPIILDQCTDTALLGLVLHLYPASCDNNCYSRLAST